jgi:epoxide hydrolase
VFPHEIIPPIRYWASFFYVDIVQWNLLPRGGHFAALEEPELLVHELWSFKEVVELKRRKDQTTGDL